jgi:hypothetical protein
VTRLTIAWIGLGVVLAGTALAQAADSPVDHYREAAKRGEVGAIRGRAFEERRRPSAPDLPLADTIVALLPRSEAWLLRLAAIKRESRESVDGFRAAAGAVRRSWETYEKRLWETGSGDLARTVTVDHEGVFALEGIPAGPWILLGSRSATYVDRTPPERPLPPGATPRPPAPASPFQPLGRLAGYHVVTYWVREVSIAAGVTEAIELTDRGVWLTGVVETREPPPLPSEPYLPPR